MLLPLLFLSLTSWSASPVHAFAHPQVATTAGSITGVLLLPAAAETTQIVTAPAGSLALGALCDSSEQCANGAQCWASNSMAELRCGNFNAACTTDEQCAYNSCVGGVCNGAMVNGTSSTSTTESVMSTMSTMSSNDTTMSTATLILQTTTTVKFSNGTMTNITTSPDSAPTSTLLPLGAACDVSGFGECAFNAQCWMTTETNTNSTSNTTLLVSVCGNFNAACESDAQCAYNTCVGGVCSGEGKVINGTTVVSTTASATQTVTSADSMTQTATLTDSATQAIVVPGGGGGTSTISSGGATSTGSTSGGASTGNDDGTDDGTSSTGSGVSPGDGTSTGTGTSSTGNDDSSSTTSDGSATAGSTPYLSVGANDAATMSRLAGAFCVLVAAAAFANGL